MWYLTWQSGGTKETFWHPLNITERDNEKGAKQAALSVLKDQNFLQKAKQKSTGTVWNFRILFVAASASLSVNLIQELEEGFP